MDKAKQAVSDFISKSGHHDTTVHEKVAPHVTRETVNHQQHEERQVALDREVHQDHHHTSVQPVHDRQVLPEQHHHNIVPTEHRTHDHRNKQETESHLQQERAQFKDETIRAPVQHTTGTAPSVAGEHVHHHVHETIQPVVHKETIEPHVVHTTVPIHEVHHNAAQHHSTSALPAVSMSEFKSQGGVLTGRDERVDRFEGEPKGMQALGHHGSGHGHSSTTGTTGSTGTSGLGSSGVDSSGVGSTGTHGHHNANGFGTDSSNTSSGLGRDTNTTSGSGLSNTSGTNTGAKPSLLQKLNPLKDSDGDGKKGFMD